MTDAGEPLVLSEAPTPTDEVAPDGSPVEVYRRLPAHGEPEIIHAAIPLGAAILELGAGAGRVSHPLLALGHPVTAVDQSARMLAAIHGAETIVGDIEALDLRRRFPCVVLGSHLVNGDTSFRDAVLATARRHVTGDGSVLIEVYDPDLDWEGVVGRRTTVGAVTITVVRAVRDGDLIRASVEYAVDGRRWSQPFEAVMLDDAGIRATLGRAGLRFDRWLDRSRGWLAAVVAH